MNERIRELLKQAEERYPKHLAVAVPEVVLRQDALEKFAELIVRECAKIAVFKDDGYIATADVAGHMAAGRVTAARLIKQHFGVEE